MHENIARRLQLSPKELERKSLRLFLNHQLRLIESQPLSLAEKHGVRTVTELDELVQSDKSTRPKHLRTAFSSTTWRQSVMYCSIR